MIKVITEVTKTESKRWNANLVDLKRLSLREKKLMYENTSHKMNNLLRIVKRELKVVII